MYARFLLNWIDFVVAVSGIVDINNLLSVYACYSAGERRRRVREAVE